MKPDFEKYRRYVDHFDVSEEEKDDIIHTVFRIMERCKDRAFRASPEQLALAADGSEVAEDSGKLIDLQASPLTGEFELKSKVEPNQPDNDSRSQ